MRISVIIPAYDDLQGVLTALNSLQALAREKDSIEYLVQDDASPNAFFPALIPPYVARTERNEVNLGFGGTCNAAASRAAGDLLFFVNQDVYGVPLFSEGWDVPLRLAFMAQEVGLAAPRLLFPDGRLQSAGGGFDGKVQPYHPHIGYSNPQHWHVAQAGVVSWATGAALCVRREVFWQLHGFDKAYRMYFEDVDLCLRAREAGFVTWYQPAVTLIHKVGSTGGSPHFAQSAQTFRARWVETGRIKAGTRAVYASYW